MDTAIPKEWQALNGTQRDILVVLAREGPSLAPEVADALGYGNDNRVYRNWDALQDAGLVESTAADDRPGPSTYNELTDAGRELVGEVARSVQGAADELAAADVIDAA